MEKLKPTEEQQKAIDYFCEWLSEKNYEKRDVFRTLKGYAGVGKTFVMKYLIEKLEREKLVSYCRLLAPTHKAAQVLHEKTDKPVDTVHAGFGLSPNVELESFNPNRPEFSVRKPVNFHRRGLIIIDECSFVNSSMHNDFILKKMIDCKCNILYVGDPAQLNPIGEDISPVFESNYFELKTIMRTEKGSILESCAYLRDNIYNPDIRLGDFRSNDFEFWSRGAFKNRLKELYKDNGTITIAWSNDKVDALNEAIQKILFPHKKDRLELVFEGQSLMIMKTGTCMDLRERKLLQQEPNRYYELEKRYGSYINSEEVVVQEVEDCKYFYNRADLNAHFECWKVATKSVDNKEKQVYLKILKPESYNDYFIFYKNLLNRAKKESDPYKRGSLWARFMDLQSSLLLFKGISMTNDYYGGEFTIKRTVSQAYARTAHKSQGTTKHTVVVLLSNIMANKKRIAERNRMLYVAISRASNKVIFIN